jgi:LemA protein
VTRYNTKRESFPANMVAGMFGFAEATLFEITDEAEREAPKVEF